MPHDKSGLRPLLALAILGAATVCAAAGAQGSRVWPPGFNSTRAGQDAMNTPFTVSSGTPPANTVRSMTTIVGSTLPFRSGSVITRLAFRRDAKYTSTSYQAASGGTLQVHLGPVRSGAHPTAAMDSNWVGTPTQGGYLSFNLPAASPTLPAAPFSLVVALTQPVTYTGGDLGIDLLFTSPSPTRWRLDAMAVDAGPVNGQFWTVGTGCRGSNGYSPYTWPDISTAIPGGTMTLGLQGARRATAPEETLALNVLGLSSTDMGGIPLPVDLRVIGMPAGCFLRCDVFATQVRVLDNRSLLHSGGSAQWALPNLPGMSGLLLYSQWMLFDLGVSAPVKMTVSNAIGISVGSADPNPRQLLGRTIWRYAACGCPNDGGIFSGREYLPIIEFTGNLQ